MILSDHKADSHPAPPGGRPAMLGCSELHFPGETVKSHCSPIGYMTVGGGGQPRTADRRRSPGGPPRHPSQRGSGSLGVGGGSRAAARARLPVGSGRTRGADRDERARGRDAGGAPVVAVAMAGLGPADRAFPALRAGGCLRGGRQQPAAVPAARAGRGAAAGSRRAGGRADHHLQLPVPRDVDLPAPAPVGPPVHEVQPHRARCAAGQCRARVATHRSRAVLPAGEPDRHRGGTDRQPHRQHDLDLGRTGLWSRSSLDS